MEHHREAASSNGQKMTDKESDAQRRQRMRRRVIVEDEKKGDINELAEAFIKNFRNQLKMQRDDSFKRFQEMIARGT